MANKQVKPRLIRGDQLLLFLDVMQTLGSYEYDFKRRRWHDPKRYAAVNPRGFSYDRVMAILYQRLGFKEHGKWDRVNPFLGLSDHGDFHRFLRENIAQLRARTFRVPMRLIADDLIETMRKHIAECNQWARMPGQDFKTQIRRENAFKEWGSLREELGAKIAYRNLLQLIASGEITEADFKEVE